MRVNNSNSNHSNQSNNGNRDNNGNQSNTSNHGNSSNNTSISDVIFQASTLPPGVIAGHADPILKRPLRLLGASREEGN